MAERSKEASAALAWLASHESDSIARWIEWLRIPSISTDMKYAAKCREAAEWAVSQLRAVGLRVELRETGDIDPSTKRGSGHPIVMGFTHAADAGKTPSVGAAHVLFYGHYDVQPVDPVKEWESGPFEPAVREARAGEGGGRRVVARGACDDKGQVMMFLEALRAWKHASGDATHGVRFTVLLEGEEESGSANLARFLQEHKNELRDARVCLISDTGMLGRGKPAITYGVRGLVYTEVVLHGANQDLHSGLWGGRAPNPNNLLARILAQLWDDQGRVTIPGFYDKVRPIAEEERASWSRLSFDAGEALGRIGLGPEADVGSGERGFSALEREWARPTCDINGIVGGYTGEGAKTVIPAKASAKVSFRLVADQQPDEIRAAFFAWLEARTPAGCRWELIDHSGGHPATVRTDSSYLKCAMAAVRDATGVEPVLIKSGGSIPVAGMLKEMLGLDTIFMGFGLDDDRVHSPNEKFEIECFTWGARSHVLFIDELSRMHG
jgi:acetylornithine deacetylase/succinyl-diaminopimelate desuccinylase-like protein